MIWGMRSIISGFDVGSADRINTVSVECDVGAG